MSAVLSMSNRSDYPPSAHVERGAREQRLDSLIHQISLTCRAVGQSLAWRDVLKKALQVAATDTTTCLQGESGTGKEVVARSIHRASPRRGGPFVAINCAALPEALLESWVGHGAEHEATERRPREVNRQRAYKTAQSQSNDAEGSRYANAREQSYRAEEA